MGAGKKAGASAPAYTIDHEAASSWKAFKLLRVLNDEDASTITKTDAAIAYAGLVAGLDEEEIVELAGGEDAQIAAVVDVVAKIISEATPKN